jgi:Predicted AAA-ATPase.
MDGIRIPIGHSEFTGIWENEYFYIDKSILIRELLELQEQSGNTKIF